MAFLQSLGEVGICHGSPRWNPLSCLRDPLLTVSSDESPR